METQFFVWMMDVFFIFILLSVIIAIFFVQLHYKRKMSGWVGVFLIPAGSVIICYAVCLDAGRYIKVTQILIFAALLMMNLAAFYMHQRIRTYAAEECENEFLRRQNEYFHLLYEDFEAQWLKLRRMRHDMANNCALEMGYLEKGQYEALMEYYQEKLGQIKGQGKIVSTGNIGMDSILNFKMTIAREYRINVESRIKVESEIGIRDIDLNILIGNLFDNAVEAVNGLLPGERKIYMAVSADRSALFLEICNPCKEKRCRDGGGDFITNKKDKARHGLGLKEVKEIVRKYNGKMDICDENGEFSVKVFLYMKGQGPDSRKLACI